MQRRALDRIVSWMGLSLTAVLLVEGGLLFAPQRVDVPLQV
jgi:hypothetical protein